MSGTRGQCVHYQGIRYIAGHNPCTAGVDYYKAFGPRDGIACRAPCIQEIRRHNGGDPIWEPWPRREQSEIRCDKRRMPTDEEIAQADAEIEAMLHRMRVVMPVVTLWREHQTKGKGRREVIECPVCKGNLHLSIAALNGHVHGKCETEGCVSWME